MQTVGRGTRHDQFHAYVSRSFASKLMNGGKKLADSISNFRPSKLACLLETNEWCVKLLISASVLLT